MTSTLKSLLSAAVPIRQQMPAVRSSRPSRTVRMRAMARTKFWDDDCGDYGGRSEDQRESGEEDEHLRQMRARLERSLGATPPRVTAEGIRMAMFRRCRGRVYRIELRRLRPVEVAPSSSGSVWLTIVGDTEGPERDTLNYMNGLAAIAQEVSDLGVVHLVLRAIDGLPFEGLEEGEERSFRLA